MLLTGSVWLVPYFYKMGKTIASYSISHFNYTIVVDADLPSRCQFADLIADQNGTVNQDKYSTADWRAMLVYFAKVVPASKFSLTATVANHFARLFRRLIGVPELIKFL
jgi:hypothetical protein